MLQYGLKYFAGTAVTMVLVLALSDALPALRDWRLLYAYFTIVVVLSEKVDIEAREKNLFIPALQPSPLALRCLSTTSRMTLCASHTCCMCVPWRRSTNRLQPQLR